MQDGDFSCPLVVASDAISPSKRSQSCAARGLLVVPLTIFLAVAVVAALVAWEAREFPMTVSPTPVPMAEPAATSVSVGCKDPFVLDGYSILETNEDCRYIATNSEIIGLIIQETNAARVRHQLRPLEIDPSLSQAAQDHSLNMAVLQQFSHGVGGTSPTRRVQLAGYTCKTHYADGSYTSGATENILISSFERHGTLKGRAWKYVESLLTSPGHRANILDREAIKIGVGVAITDTQLLPEASFRKTIFVTQNFGTC